MHQLAGDSASVEWLWIYGVKVHGVTGLADRSVAHHSCRPCDIGLIDPLTSFSSLYLWVCLCTVLNWISISSCQGNSQQSFLIWYQATLTCSDSVQLLNNWHAVVEDPLFSPQTFPTLSSLSLLTLLRCLEEPVKPKKTLLRGLSTCDSSHCLS